MKAWRVDAFGEPAEQWQLRDDVAECEPGPGELKIKVEACGLGLPDVLMCNNNYPMMPELPFTPSQEACGTVAAVGEGVPADRVGQRVLGVTKFLDGAGGLAEYCLMDAASALPVPDDMPAEEAAGFFIPYMTAWVGLIRRGGLQASETLLVLGASGSSGAAAVQLGKAVGARVIAVVGGPEKAEFCRGIGADEVIDHKVSDITGTARALTDGRGVDVIFDPVGGKAGRAAFMAIAFEGRFILIGYASGEWAEINLVETLFGNVSLVGAMPVGFAPEVFGAGVEELMDYRRRGLLDLSRAEVFDFVDGRDAVAQIAGRNTAGKVVVRIPGS